MNTQQISHFVLSVCSCLRPSQAKTFSVLVSAAMGLERAAFWPEHKNKIVVMQIAGTLILLAVLFITVSIT